MMNKFYLTSFLFLFLVSSAVQSQVVTFGTGTASNTGTTYPAPYGNYYWGARHQFIIRASEIATGGISGPKLITSLAFNVKVAAGTLQGFTIGMKNTQITSFSNYDYETGITQVYTHPAYTDVTGWNTHTFQKGFYWDGVSNVIVEVCFNNSAFINSHAQTYWSTTAFSSVLYTYNDISGICSAAASSLSSNRPNMRLNFTPVPPPDADFITTDTIFVNTSYTFKNTSTNVAASYWKVYGMNADKCNSYGCFLDTTSTNLKVTFGQMGTFFIKLVTPGYIGYDSVLKTIYVDTTHRKPKANFYAAATQIAAPDVLNFYDSSLYGASGWKWYITPECIGCANNINQIPNYFSPSDGDQNPVLQVFDGGTFDVCLVAWNDKGRDTLCRKNYLKVIQGFSMCNGADSISTYPTGYVFDPGGPTQNYQAILTGQCKSGFVINPGACYDSLVINILQFKTRNTDTLEIRDGGLSTSPLIKKIAGANIAAANKIFYPKSGKAFLRLYTNGSNFPPGDSGFVIKWTTVSPAKIYTANPNLCTGDSAILKLRSKPGRTYQWLFNDQELTGFTDSTYIAKTAGNYRAVVTSTGCLDSSDVIPVGFFARPSSGFTVNNLTQCFFKNSFQFTDTSTLSQPPFTRLWSFGDNTTSTNANPVKKYVTSGTFKVKLQITTSGTGCKDSMIQYVQNLPSPAAKISYSNLTPDICLFDSTRLSTPVGSGYHYQWYYNSLPLSSADTLSYLWIVHPGSYKVKVNTSLGCDSMSSPVISQIIPSPVTPVITKNGFTLYSSTANGYQWLLENNPVAGATLQSFTPSAVGNYRVRIDSSNGCKSVSSSIYMNSTTGVQENIISKTLNIYPNPASSEVKVDYAENFTWTIVDITGRTLMNNEELLGTHTIDISALSHGIYFIKVFTPSETIIRKIEKL